MSSMMPMPDQGSMKAVELFRIVVLACALCIPDAELVLANPSDGVVSAGQATITSSGSHVDIDQSTSRAVIDWRSFNIGPDETTAFHQPSSSSMTLNRVKADDPSQILGTLTAIGHIILINPNGVFFGPGSRVDVGGITATTANMLNRDFMAGRMNFDQPGNPNARIINEGSITARDEGLVN